MTKPDVFTYTAPASWASYLINGDDSGIDPPDKAACDKWIESLDLGLPCDCGEPYFSWRNDATNLGGDVCEYTFITFLAREAK